MNNYNNNFCFLSNYDNVPSWYRTEHYEYCDSMYTSTYKAVQFSLFNKLIKFFS